LDGIIDEYADTINYDKVSSLFAASLSDEINLSEKKKIAEENILKLRQARLDELSKHSTDIVQLQKIIHEQSKLKKEGVDVSELFKEMKLLSDEIKELDVILCFFCVSCFA